LAIGYYFPTNRGFVVAQCNLVQLALFDAPLSRVLLTSLTCTNL